MKPRLKEKYHAVRKQLQQDLGLTNVMEVPCVTKIVLNIGVKEAVNDSKALQVALDALEVIAGQKPVRTKARKSIAGFKIREGMPIGAMVTLRRDNMYTFLDKLINVALPAVRDFQGVTTKLDSRGNYNLGIKEWIIFPELDLDSFSKIYGMNVAIHTSAKTDQQGFALLKSLGMPFKKTA